MYIALDSMHLAISYHQGIIGILTSDLGLKSNALADHLESVFRVRYSHRSTDFVFRWI